MINTEGGISLNLFDIERFALNDGPGIRTVLFFMGCPLSCLWCSNPESQSGRPRLFYRQDRCLGCRNCLGACAEGALSFGDALCIDRKRCTACGACAEVCNTGALSLVGKRWTIEEVLEAVRRDESFYLQSGGGVTFSGGEPTAQPKGLRAAAERIKELRYHTSIETCGFFDWERVSDAFRFIDLFLFDLKHLDSKRHEELTGVPNAVILENFQRLIREGKDVTVRFPVVPGLNDDEEHLHAMADYIASVSPGAPVDILPYHRLGKSKYASLGLTYACSDLGVQDEARIREVVDLFAGRGLRARIEK